MTVRRPTQTLVAGALALLVHVLFVGALVFGVSWKTEPQQPVYVDLWRAPPSSPPPPAPPKPAPQAVPRPEVKPEPKPPVVPDKPGIRPDIALKEKERREKEAARQREMALQEEAKRLEEARKREQEQARRRIEEQLRQEEAARLEEERRAAETRRLEAELARRRAQEESEREAAEALERERRRMEIQRRQAAVGRMVEDYKGRIVGKIRGLMRLPPTLTGNPEVVFRVRLLPNGEVLKVTLVQSSGHAAYDQEMERAILKASPLPLPPDREAAAAFVGELNLKFRPREE